MWELRSRALESGRCGEDASVTCVSSLSSPSLTCVLTDSGNIQTSGIWVEPTEQGESRDPECEALGRPEGQV